MKNIDIIAKKYVTGDIEYVILKDGKWSVSTTNFYFDKNDWCLRVNYKGRQYVISENDIIDFTEDKGTLEIIIK